MPIQRKNDTPQLISLEELETNRSICSNSSFSTNSSITKEKTELYYDILYENCISLVEKLNYETDKTIIIEIEEKLYEYQKKMININKEYNSKSHKLVYPQIFYRKNKEVLLTILNYLTIDSINNNDNTRVNLIQYANSYISKMNYLNDKYDLDKEKLEYIS